MPGNEHLMFALEESWGEWTTPDEALEVTASTVNPAMPLMVNEDTGGGKGRRPGVPGEMTVSGPITTKLYGKTLGFLLRSPYGARVKALAELIGPPQALTSVSKASPAVATCPAAHGLTSGDTVFVEGVVGASPFVGGYYVATVTAPTTFTIPVDTSAGTAGAGGTFSKVITASDLVATKTVLLPNDELAFDSFSIQKRYTVVKAENIKGAKLNGFTITARAKQFVEVKLDILAQEAVATSQTYGEAQGVASVGIANPGLVTMTNVHGLTTGDFVLIAGSLTTPSIDGVQQVIVTTTHAFTVPVNVTVGSTSKGTVSKISTGATWEDGTPAPLVIGDPPPYASGQPDPITFAGGVLKTGATVIQDAETGELIALGGETRCDFDSIELDFKFNLSNTGFGVCLGRRTVQSIEEGKREIDLKFEPNFAIANEEWYDHWLAGDNVVIELLFEGPVLDVTSGAKYRWHWVFPLVRTKGAPNPELNAQYGLKRIAVDTQPFADMDLARLDNCLTLQSTEDYSV